jgi:hypothetical protein
LFFFFEILPLLYSPFSFLFPQMAAGQHLPPLREKWSIFSKIYGNTFVRLENRLFLIKTKWGGGRPGLRYT